MEIDHEYTKELVCPHCGYEDHDAWEFGPEEEGETSCASCGSEFAYTKNIRITYTTRKLNHGS